MVGSSNEISRETWRYRPRTVRVVKNREWGPLLAEWSWPCRPYAVAGSRERINDIDKNWMKRPSGVRTLVVAMKSGSKTDGAKGGREVEVEKSIP